MEKQILPFKRSNRYFAFGAIVFSTVSITGCLLVFPLIFHYLQTLEASLRSDLDFCNIRSRDMWNAIIDIHGKKGDSSRMTRAAIMRQEVKHGQKSNGRSHAKKTKKDFWADRIEKDAKPVGKNSSNATNENDKNATKSVSGTMTAITPFIQCCTCHRGPPGPIGLPGQNGVPGDSGPRGKAGERGDPSPSDKSVIDKNLKQCPCEIVPGDPGQKGPKGIDGPYGDPGAPGVDGKQGEQGIRGPGGFPGRDGRDGPKGSKGDEGKQITKFGKPGEKGNPGKVGDAGPQGPPGIEGKDGKQGLVGPAGWPGVEGLQGRPGKPGPDGPDGKAGDNGDCTHCPTARLAPGY